MSNYTPPYSISDSMIELLSTISEKVGGITGYKLLESKPHLRKNNRVRSIHSSLKIEANSLSLSEVRDIAHTKSLRVLILPASKNSSASMAL